MKYSQRIGIFAAIVLMIACFLPWTYHPDLNKYFNGFFSEDNIYGKPGKVFLVLSMLAIVFFRLPKLWAKRWNLLVTAFVVAWAIKNFIVYSGCYRGICPQKQFGLWVMLLSSIIMLMMALIPDTKMIASRK